MDTLLHAGLSNAVVAAVLAVLTAAVAWGCRRPAVAHALWLLVLVKLVTPPLLSLPLPWPAPALTDPMPDIPASFPEPAPAVATVEPLETLSVPEGPAPEGEPFVETAEVELPRAAVAVLPEADGPAPAPVVVAASLPWSTLLVGVWLTGSACWFLLAVARIWRFQRLLRFAVPAKSEDETRLRALAARLGLGDVPHLWLMPGAVAPMLWAVGGVPRLLVPATLWGRFGPEQRDALLVHELAHWRRRDHWVRWLEFVVTGLYWWHPVVWWARRELHEAEELCCDAWVVWALPDSGRAYATALVETVDFLSPSSARPPAVASGLGHVQNLRRRLTMILRGSTPRTLTWAGLLAVLGLAAVLLPLAPSWAQQPRREQDRDRERDEQGRQRALEETRRALEKEKAAAEAARARAGQAAEAARREGAGQGNVEAEMRELRHHIERMRDEMAHAEKRLRELAERAEGRGRTPGAAPPAGALGGRVGPFGSGGGSGVRGFPGAVNEQRLQQIESKLDRLLKEMEELRRVRPQPGGPAFAPFGGRRPGDAPPPGRRGDAEAGRERPVPTPAARPGEAPRPPQPPKPPKPPRDRGDGGEAGRDAPRPPQPARPDRGAAPAAESPTVR